MKRKIYIFLSFLAVLLVLTCVWVPYSHSKNYIQNYIRKNADELTDYADKTIETRPTQSSRYHGWEVSYYDTTDMVQFLVFGWGLAPSTKYRGFFYSPDDIPLGFQGTTVEFEPSGNGWVWEEEQGDNRQYVEKIVDCWYWFEMEF